MATLNHANLQWRKSSRSTSYGNCVEVAFAGPAVVARDSKDSDGAALAFDAVTWANFIDGIRAGRFEA
ncbi:hypothetical protein GCM10011581_49120 [Saccharopolyspora subtropica]|uniref:DUF397 domain-containing protein n=1 Tax=Saccharopolyspora thermophila TaxID=89367 RepID=A0A917KC53_9PSEU|nr:DUF397 domain-containing protein [Saccharopolyspora subtropica]GGJ06341.1 hypothetical protein GCM10011581_49120 [Saccharopolyspora subtropica]